MRRKRAESAVAAAIAALTVALCAGCTSGSPDSSSTAATAPAARSVSAAGPSTPPAGSAAAAAPVLPARALASPGCSGTTATGGVPGSVRSALLTTGGAPFGVAVTPDGRWGFVVVQGGATATGGALSAVDVLRMSQDAATPTPFLVRSISVPGQPLGATITPNGKYLLVASDSGAVVISVARAEAGTAGAVLGTLSAPLPVRGKTSLPAAGGAIEVATSPDGRFAFVTLEDDEQAAVFNVAAAVTHGFSAADYVGSITLGGAPVGITVSPNGRWLYATSEVGEATQDAVGLGPATTVPASLAGSLSCPATAAGETPGTLTVINLAEAETDPALSVVATVRAGFQPVRVITSGDGTEVWVTARASDDLLCFAAARLTSDPAHALVAIVRVGEAPVGLAAVRGGTLIVVADSNRFAASGVTSDLSVVNVAAALGGRPAVAGNIPTGLFPRDMTLSANGTLLVSDYSSGQLQAVDTLTIPPA